MPPTVDIYAGRDPRLLPLYSVTDAARIVRVPAATLRAWALGRGYPTQEGVRRWEPLIEVADRGNGRLSFTNLVELHVLSGLRGKQVRVDRIRSATDMIRNAMRTEHPLADVDVQTDSVHVYVEYLGSLINASTSQTELRPIVERYLKRIERSPEGLAQRLYPMIDESDPVDRRMVVIDPRLRFGRPVLAAKNIETWVIADRRRAGESVSSLMDDFGIDEAEVTEAVRFEDMLRHAA